MQASETSSTRPYLLRALFEWCNDNGLTPHIAVRVGRNVQVPREFVRDGEIVLNVSYDATSGLQLGNDYIQFNARFGGKPREIIVPVDNVIAIYARETGQGMAFPPPEEGVDTTDVDASQSEVLAPESHEASDAPSTERVGVVQLVTSKLEEPGDDDGGAPSLPPSGARPALKRIK